MIAMDWRLIYPGSIPAKTSQKLKSIATND